MGTAHPSVLETRWWSVEEMDSYDLQHIYSGVDQNPIRVDTLSDWIREQHNRGDMNGVHL